MLKDASRSFSRMGGEGLHLGSGLAVVEQGLWCPFVLRYMEGGEK